MHLSGAFAVGVAALLPQAFAACTDNGQQYNSIPSSYSQPNSCIPGGYGQAYDAGQTNSQAALAAKCSNLCSTQFSSTCNAWLVSVNKAADSGLMTGTCYFYTNLPANPSPCANAPNGGIVGGTKDFSNQCLASSTAAAKAYCSSFLSYGTQTVYSSTSTPVATSVTTSTVTATTITVSSCPGYGTLKKKTLLARATTVAAPACLATTLPASRVSSACSCLGGITSTTLTTLTQAPTSTTISVSLTTVTATSTTVLPLITNFKIVAIDSNNARHYVRLTKLSGVESYSTYWDDTDTSASPRFIINSNGQCAYGTNPDTALVVFGKGGSPGQIVFGNAQPNGLYTIISCSLNVDGVSIDVKFRTQYSFYLYQDSNSLWYQGYTAPAANVAIRLVAEDVKYCLAS